MTNFTVVLDSCVLYPAPLRDLLMHLALSDLYRAKWTAQIHEEWMRNVLANRKDLTLNLKDFPKEIISEYGIEVQHPDQFISYLIDLAPSVVCAAVKRLRKSLKNPVIGSNAFLAI